MSTCRQCTAGIKKIPIGILHFPMFRKNIPAARKCLPTGTASFLQEGNCFPLERIGYHREQGASCGNGPDSMCQEYYSGRNTIGSVRNRHIPTGNRMIPMGIKLGTAGKKQLKVISLQLTVKPGTKQLFLIFYC